MVNIVNTAIELGYIQMPDHMLISLEEMKNYKDEQLVLITTGSHRYRSSRSSITLPIPWYNLSLLKHPRRIIEFCNEHYRTNAEKSQ